MHTFEFITETSNIAFDVAYVNAEDPVDALVKYCEHTGEVKQCYLNVMKDASFADALEIARDNLRYDIIRMDDISGYISYFDNPKKSIDIIE